MAGEGVDSSAWTDAVAVIEDWVVCADASGRTASPEAPKPVLLGVVTGHEIYEDGSQVTTSSVKGRIGDRLLVASGRLYELGAPDRSYELRFPGARRRLLAARTCVALIGTCENCTCEKGRIVSGREKCAV